MSRANDSAQRPQIKPHPVITPDQCLNRNASAPYIFHDPVDSSPEPQPKTNYRLAYALKPAAGMQFNPNYNGQISPYLNGRRNNNYNNPTYQSNIFAGNNSGLAYQERKSSNSPTPRSVREDQSPHNSILRSQSGDLRASLRESPSPLGGNRESLNGTKVPTFGEIGNEDKEAHHSRRASQEPIGRRGSQGSVGRRASQDSSISSSQQGSNNQQVIDACHNCHNMQMIYEKEQKQARELNYERELDRRTLEHVQRIHQKRVEEEKEKKVLQREISKQNYEAVLQKHGQYVPQFQRPKKTAWEKRAEAQKEQNEQRRLKSLHQNIMDKIFEASESRDNLRRDASAKSVSFNKTQLENGDGLRMKRAKQASVDYSPETQKNLLFSMYDNAINREKKLTKDRMSASAFNLNRSFEKQVFQQHGSDVDLDNSMRKSHHYNRSMEGKDIVAKLHDTHDNVHRNKQEKAKKISQANLKTIVKNNSKAEEERLSVARPLSAEKVWGYNPRLSQSELEQNGLFSGIYRQEENNRNRISNTIRDCKDHNKQEAIAKSNTMRRDIDYEDWIEQDSNLFIKIQKKSEENARQQFEQRQQNKSSLRNQIEQKLSKLKTEELKKAAFQEKPLLVCSHKVSSKCCGMCNKKVSDKRTAKMVIESGRTPKSPMRFIQKGR